MCFNICIYATDFYLKVLMEKYEDKNLVDFMQIRQFIERILCSCTRAKHVHSIFSCFAFR